MNHVRGNKKTTVGRRNKKKNKKIVQNPHFPDLLYSEYSYYIQILAKKVTIYRLKICAGSQCFPWALRVHDRVPTSTSYLRGKFHK
jgi:hypothetical protein